MFRKTSLFQKEEAGVVEATLGVLESRVSVPGCDASRAEISTRPASSELGWALASGSDFLLVVELLGEKHAEEFNILPRKVYHQISNTGG